MIPVKPSGIGKSRLTVSAAARARFARAFAIDTVRAALASSAVCGVLVVTADAAAAEEFRALGATVVPEAEPGGIDAALQRSAEITGIDSPRAALLGDLPALNSDDLTEALRLAADHARSVIADAEGTGTTMVTANRGVPWRSHFGEGSFAAHRTAGFTPLPLDPASTLRFDVDTADQLSALRDGTRHAALGEATLTAIAQAAAEPGTPG